MNSEPKVSVIIPVYNSAKYLNDCLNSIIKQDLRDIEIICVDDGSTDESLQILNRFAKKDGRITVLQQKNIGAGTARNVGLGIAKGRYLSFIDSDDIVMSEMLRVLYEKLEKTNNDIGICDYCCIDSYGQAICDNYIRKEYLKLAQHSAFSYRTHPFDVMNGFQNAAWNKLFRADFIKSNGIFFQELRRTNDLFFTKSAMLSTEKICCVSEKLIYYRVSSSSLQGSNHKNPKDFVDALLKLKGFLVQKDIYALLENEFKFFAITIIKYNLNSVGDHCFIYTNLLNYIKLSLLNQLGIKYKEINATPFIKIILGRIFNIKNSRDHLHKVLTIFGMDFYIKNFKYNKD